MQINISLIFVCTECRQADDGDLFFPDWYYRTLREAMAHQLSHPEHNITIESEN